MTPATLERPGAWPNLCRRVGIFRKPLPGGTQETKP